MTQLKWNSPGHECAREIEWADYRIKSWVKQWCLGIINFSDEEKKIAALESLSLCSSYSIIISELFVLLLRSLKAWAFLHFDCGDRMFRGRFLDFNCCRMCIIYWSEQRAPDGIDWFRCRIYRYSAEKRRYNPIILTKYIQKRAGSAKLL